MSRSFALALLLALPAVAGLPTAPARAADRPPAVTVDTQGRMAIGGVLILDLADKSVNDTMLTRNNEIAGRLVEALWRINRKGRWASPSVTVARALSINGQADPTAAREPWILIEGVPVMKVTYQDSVATGQSTQVLANHYAGCFRKALKRIYTP